MKKLNLKSISGEGLSYKPVWDKDRVDSSRLMILKMLVGSCLVFISIRLVFLQAVQGNELRLRSDNNRIFERRVGAPRGAIVDRHGEALAINEPLYKVLTDEKGMVLAESELVNEEMFEEVRRLDERRVVYGVGREYPFGSLFGHVVGYVGEVSEEDLTEGKAISVEDQVGKAGIEQEFEGVLKGRAGSELIEVDAQGRLLRRVGLEEAVAGEELRLSLDVGVQEVLQKELEGKVGVGVVTVPRTGEVLGLFSSPGFDPNVFSHLGVEDERSKEKRQEEVRKILTSEERVLVNRAISGTYPPGSVFKVVPSLAGLETGVLSSETEIEDTGEIVIDSFRYRNWYFSKYGGTEGQVDVVSALKRSNDIFYYKVGEWLGVDRLANWSEKMGLGSVTGIDLPGEKQGLVPNSIWKERVKGEPWYLGNTYHFAIGQGDLLVTPIQLNQMFGVVATDGSLCKPVLVQSIGGEDQRKVECKHLDISQESLDVVKEGLVAACQSGGTGFPFFDYDLSQYGEAYSQEGRNVVACKTGTAQFFDPEDRTHAWFSVFAPAENPEIMVTVLVEGGGEGSEVAAPIAKKVLEYWFENKSG